MYNSISSIIHHVLEMLQQILQRKMWKYLCLLIYHSSSSLYAKNYGNVVLVFGRKQEVLVLVLVFVLVLVS